MRSKIKTVAYVRRMITTGKWMTRLPSISYIMDKLHVSRRTVLACLRFMEEKGEIERNGLDYYIIPQDLRTVYKNNKNLYYLLAVQRNLYITELLNNGAKYLGNMVVLDDGKGFKVAYINSGRRLYITKQEMNDLLKRPVTVEQLVAEKDCCLKEKKRQFMRQLEVKKLYFAMKKAKEWQI